MPAVQRCTCHSLHQGTCEDSTVPQLYSPHENKGERLLSATDRREKHGTLCLSTTGCWSLLLFHMDPTVLRDRNRFSVLSHLWATLGHPFLLGIALSVVGQPDWWLYLFPLFCSVSNWTWHQALLGIFVSARHKNLDWQLIYSLLTLHSYITLQPEPSNHVTEPKTKTMSKKTLSIFQKTYLETTVSGEDLSYYITPWIFCTNTSNFKIQQLLLIDKKKKKKNVSKCTSHCQFALHLGKLC